MGKLTSGTASAFLPYSPCRRMALLYHGCGKRRRSATRVLVVLKGTPRVWKTGLRRDDQHSRLADAAKAGLEGNGCPGRHGPNRNGKADALRTGGNQHRWGQRSQVG